MSLYKMMVEEQAHKYKTFKGAAELFLLDVGNMLRLEEVSIDEIENVRKIEYEVPMEKIIDVLTKEEISSMFPNYLETFLENEFNIRTYASWLYANVQFKEDSFVLSVDLSNITYGLRGDKEGEQRDLVIQSIKEMRKNFFNVDSYGVATAVFEIDDAGKVDLGTLSYSLESLGFTNVKIKFLEKETKNEKHQISISFLNEFKFKGI